MKDIVEELDEWVATFDGAPLSVDNTFKPSPEGVRILKAAAEYIQELRRQCQLMRIELHEMTRRLEGEMIDDEESGNYAAEDGGDKWNTSPYHQRQLDCRRPEGAMSAGRWVWVPEGWKVVPPYEDYPMCPTSRDVMEEVLASAPEPPSGWQRGDLPNHGQWLGYDPTLDEKYRYFAGTFYAVRENEWWTTLPPPPEEEA